MQDTSCPLCSSKQTRKKYSLPDQSIFAVKGLVHLFHCRECDFIFNPHARKLTPQDYFSYYQGTKDYDALKFKVIKDIGAIDVTFQNYYEFLLQACRRANLDPQNLEALDIGGGAGGMVFLGSQKGLRFDLMDFCLTRNRIAREVFDIKNVYSDLDSIEKRYDMITLWQVIEHVPDPVSYLKEVITKLAKPSCIILIATPNTESVGRRLYGRRWQHLISHHVSLFSKKSIVTAMETAGLNVVHFDSSRMYSTSRIETAKDILRNLRKPRNKPRALNTDGLCVAAVLKP
jgi:hypothetical protein